MNEEYKYKTYTNEELLQCLRDFRDNNNRVPLSADFRDVSVKPNVSTFYNRFGSFNNALKLAGIEKDKFRDNCYSDDELIGYLKHYYDAYGKVPTTRDLKKNKFYPNPETYRQRYGGHKEALIEAGLYDLRKDKHQFDRKEISKEEILDKLQSYIDKHQKLPTVEDLNSDPDMPSSSVITNKFGGINDAICLLGYDTSIKRMKVDFDIAFESLKKLHKELGRTPTSRDIDNCEYTPYTKSYTERFGNIYEVLDLAGIPNMPKSTYFNNDEIIAMWYDLKNELGRIPTTTELEKYKLNLQSAIKIKWGYYIDFLKEIGEDSNYNKYGCKVYTTAKGSKCFSCAEYLITSWFEDNNIKFDKETRYSDVMSSDDTKRRFDWVVDFNNTKYYIEYFGIKRIESYHIKTKKKIEDCMQNKVNLIALYPDDLKKPLDEVFSFLQ